jgi:hypothetical protein
VGWRLGSFPVMKDGAELAVTGVMTSVSFVRRFSKKRRSTGIGNWRLFPDSSLWSRNACKSFDLFLSLC